MTATALEGEVRPRYDWIAQHDSQAIHLLPPAARRVHRQPRAIWVDGILRIRAQVRCHQTVTGHLLAKRRVVAEKMCTDCLFESFGYYSVYRLYGQNDLFYVGCTARPIERFNIHRRSSHWWRQVDSFRLAYYRTAEEASYVEHRLIKRLAPPNNGLLSRPYRPNPHVRPANFEALGTYSGPTAPLMRPSRHRPARLSIAA